LTDDPVAPAVVVRRHGSGGQPRGAGTRDRV